MSFTYSTIEQNDEVFAIDQLGINFVSNSRAVDPFEAYIYQKKTSNTIMGAPRAIALDFNKIGTGIEELQIMKDQGSDYLIYVENGMIKIITEKNMSLDVYSVSGSLIRRVNVFEGVNYIDDLQKGIYIIGNRKVVF